MRRLTMILAILALAAVPGSLTAQSPAATLFRGVRVFDGERVLATSDVLISHGRVAALGRGLTPPAGATVIDGTGKTLLPGFIDAHTHSWGEALREALMFGVTTELDMFTDAALARTMRAEQKAAKALDRADLFSAGILVTAPGGHGTEYGFSIPTITKADSAQAFVDARIAEGSDWIKIVYDDGALFGLKWPTLSREVLKAVIDAAHARERLAVVHVSTAAQATEAVDAGADGLVHLFTDAALSASFAQLAKARSAFVIPTLVVLKSITGTPGGSGLANDPQLAPYVTLASKTLLGQAFPGRAGAGKRTFDVAAQTVGQLHETGVPVLAGTDAPNPGTAHGVALHRELELLVSAGLSPVEALAAATSVPARAFRLRDRGRVAPGLRADLVLVDGDPTTNITATRAIAGVWKAGVPVDRKAFADQVVAERNRAAATPEVLAAGLISNFEGGKPDAAFGTAWIATTDSYAGGKSTGEMNIVDAGAGGAGKALALTGTIADAVPYAWSGAMWSPGNQPMQPADLSSKQEIVFRAKGDGATYRVLVMAQSKGMTPLQHEFVAPAAWTEVVVPWSAFGIDGKDVTAIMFVAGPKPGSFALHVDDVRLR